MTRLFPKLASFPLVTRVTVQSAGDREARGLLSALDCSWDLARDSQ